MIQDFRKGTVFLKVPRTSPACYSGKTKTSTEHWCSDNDRGKQQQPEKNLSEWYFAHHKSHVDWPGIEYGPPR